MSETLTVTEELSTDEIVKRVKAGEVELFGQIVQNTDSMLRRFLWRKGVHPNDVEDVTQDTYMLALQGIDSYKGGNFEAWLITIARNRAASVYRRKSKTNEIPHDLDNLAGDPLVVTEEPAFRAIEDDEDIEQVFDLIREESGAEAWDNLDLDLIIKSIMAGHKLKEVADIVNKQRASDDSAKSIGRVTVSTRLTRLGNRLAEQGITGRESLLASHGRLD